MHALAASSRPAQPTSVWKCPGASGQVQQNRLIQNFVAEDGATRVISEFEDAIRQLDFQIDPDDSGRLSSSDIVTTWRAHAPMRDHRVLLRVSEMLLHILTALRAEKTELAEARVCLGLAALDQVCRDAGKWDRGSLIAMLPEPPYQAYQSYSGPEQKLGKDGGKFGDLSVFCSLERSTVAMAVFKDRIGAALK